MTIEPITDKEIFARTWLARADRDPFAAAVELFPTDMGRALAVSREWPQDPEVLALMGEIDVDAQGVPTDNDMIREVWRRVIATSDDEIAFKGVDTIAKIRGKGVDQNTTINNLYTDNRSVMIVPTHGSDEDWESRAREQQARLVADAS